MDTAIRRLLTPDIRDNLLDRFGVKSGSWKLCDGYESFIYDCRVGETEQIIRISHNSRRSESMILGELDWLRYLSEHGLNVAQANLSLEGHLVEAEPCEHGAFLAASFTKLPGKPATRSDWNEDLFYKMGHLTGELHNLTQLYRPADPRCKRPQWYEETGDFARKYLTHGSDALIVKASERLHEKLRTLPTSPAEYGLVHFDFHSGNFHVFDHEIYLFDFDDCQYCWFAADIAITLFYALPVRLLSENDEARANHFFGHFLRGYSAVAPFHPAWLELIPLFLTYREIDLYICIKRSFHENEYDEWIATFMNGRKEAIEADRPYLPFSLRL